MEYLNVRGGRGAKVNALSAYSLTDARRVAKKWLRAGATFVRIESRAEASGGGRSRVAYKGRKASRFGQRVRGVRVCRLDGARMVCTAKKKRKK